MNARYERVSPISPPISDMKNPHPTRSRYPIFRTFQLYALFGEDVVSAVPFGEESLIKQHLDLTSSSSLSLSPTMD